MSQAEFERWADFYNIAPFDDLHIHHRPAALIARSMSGGDITELLNWLQPAYNVGNETEYSDEDLAIFKALGFDKPPRRS